MTNASEIPTPPAQAGRSKTWLIVVIVLVVVFCLVAVCLGAGWYVWTNGDRWLDLSRLSLASLT